MLLNHLFENRPGGTLNEFAPGNGGGESGRWYTDDQMTDIVGDGWWNDLDVSGDIPKQQMIQEAQAWLDDQGYNVQVLNCKLNDDDMEWYIEGSFYNPNFAKKGMAEAQTEPEQQQIDANRQAALRREREPSGSEKIDAQLAQQNAQRQEYERTGNFWLKRKDTQEHISDEFVGKAAAVAAAQDLLKQQPNLRGNIVITAYGPGETQGVAEATGDVKFDKMLKGITGKKEVAKQQKIDTKQQARDAFGGMFGGGNPADKLSIRKKGVAEGSDRAEAQADYMEGQCMVLAVAINQHNPKRYPIGYIWEYNMSAGAPDMQMDDDEWNDLSPEEQEEISNDISRHSVVHAYVRDQETNEYIDARGRHKTLPNLWGRMGQTRFEEFPGSARELIDITAHGDWDEVGDQVNFKRGQPAFDSLSGPAGVKKALDYAVKYLGVVSPESAKSPNVPQNQQGVAEGGYSGVDDTDTVGFSVNSERAYQAVMARFGDQIDHDETSGTMYVPARLWPKVEMVAFDADGEGATPADGLDEGEKVGNMDADAFDAAMARLKKLAGAGPMKTVYDPNRRVYRNVPTAVQPGTKK